MMVGVVWSCGAELSLQHSTLHSAACTQVVLDGTTALRILVFVYSSGSGCAWAQLFMDAARGTSHIVAKTLAFLYQLNMGFSPLLT